MKELWRGSGPGVWAAAVGYWAQLFDAMSGIELVRENPLDIGVLLVPKSQEERIDPEITSWLARRNHVVMFWDADPAADGAKFLADFEARRVEGWNHFLKFVEHQQERQQEVDSK